MSGAVTHDVEPYGGRVCRCAACGAERLCTPTSDFFTVAAHTSPRPLFCEGCFYSQVGLAPLKCVGADIMAGCPDQADAEPSIIRPSGARVVRYHCAKCLPAYSRKYDANQESS